jgi:predicted secreted protein
LAWTTIIAIYFIIWWTVLFAVLPFGITSQHETARSRISERAGGCLGSGDNRDAIQV